MICIKILSGAEVVLERRNSWDWSLLLLAGSTVPEAKGVGNRGVKINRDVIYRLLL